MGRGDTRPRGQRQLRVGELIRHALAQSLERGEAHDPGLVNASITVTEVRVSPDLRNATAFVMPLGGGDAEEVLQSLNRAAPFFRRRIGEEVDLRRLPNIAFELDSSFDNATHIDELLRMPSVSADIRSRRDDSGDDGA
jgi:ribosome-binding factor A